MAASLSCLSLATAEPDANPKGDTKEKKADTPEARGRALLADTGELAYASCLHCHSILAPEKAQKQTPRKQAHTLFGAAIRAGWRNRNTYADAAEASQFCAKKFQGRRKGLSAAQRSDLLAVLKTRVPQGKTTLPKRKVGKPRVHKDIAKYDGGDAKRGQTRFANNCAECHHDGDDSISFALKPGKKRKAFIVRKVRGFDAKRRFRPSAMGYYTPERLSDDALRDILAYLGR